MSCHSGRALCSGGHRGRRSRACIQRRRERAAVLNARAIILYRMGTYIGYSDLAPFAQISGSLSHMFGMSIVA